MMFMTKFYFLVRTRINPKLICVWIYLLKSPKLIESSMTDPLNYFCIVLYALLEYVEIELVVETLYDVDLSGSE